MKRYIIIKKLITALFILIITSCTTQKNFVQTDLYFGLSQNNANIISDSAWNIFVRQNISKVFSAGFTILNSNGNWVNENDNKLYTEPSHVVISVNKMNKYLSDNIDSLRAAYKKNFQQQSVLRIDKKAFGKF